MAEEASRTSLALLGARLHRLEYLLSGSTDLAGIPDTIIPGVGNENVSNRLDKLEDDLRRLKARSAIAQDLMRLYSRYPELFQINSDPGSSKITEPSTIAAIVLAHASLYPETASRLSSLKTLPIPEAKACVCFIDLSPRIEKAIEVQARQEQEASELRTRSAKLMEWWVNIGVIRMGDCWADWEARVRNCGRTLQVAQSVSARRST